MENLDQYNELLVRYLLNEVDTEEEAVIKRWLEKAEQNRQHFEALKKTWNLVAVKDTANRINVEEEWNHFQQTITTKETKVISMAQTQPYETEVIEKDNRSRIHKVWTSIAVAASILLIIGFGWKILFDKKEVPVAITTLPKDSVMVIVQHEVNTTAKVRIINLEDGSQVALMPNSELTFSKPFIDNKRDISLIGKATFTVAKDKTKPFTVFSGDLATTALGTEFMVTAFKKERSITVRLLEGKVVVKSVDSALKKLKHDIYLVPGQELIYDKSKASAKVQNFNKKITSVKEGTPVINDDPLVPQNEKGNWIMFNNQSLVQVFEQLKVIYDVDIIYSKNDVQKKYFIGKFDKEAPLDTILKQIATLNNLTVTVESNKYIITKP